MDFKYLLILIFGKSFRTFGKISLNHQVMEDQRKKFSTQLFGIIKSSSQPFLRLSSKTKKIFRLSEDFIILLQNIFFPEFHECINYIFSYCQSQSNHIGLVFEKIFLKKQSITSFCVWGSTGSRIEPLRGDSSRFTFRFPGVPGTHFINLERLTAESSLEPFTGCEPRMP